MISGMMEASVGLREHKWIDLAGPRGGRVEVFLRRLLNWVVKMSSYYPCDEMTWVRVLSWEEMAPLVTCKQLEQLENRVPGETPKRWSGRGVKNSMKSLCVLLKSMNFVLISKEKHRLVSAGHWHAQGCILGKSSLTTTRRWIRGQAWT